MTQKQTLLAVSGVALGYLAACYFKREKKSNFIGFKKKRVSGKPVWLSGDTQLACNCGQTMRGTLNVDQNTSSSEIYNFRQKCLNGGFCDGVSGTIQVVRKSNSIR